MSKRYNIRWTQADEQELRRTVKNFNAKVARLEKKHPNNKGALPERVTVRQMKELIDTRQDLNRELKSLQRFSRRGAEELITAPDNNYNTKITKWQKEEMVRRIPYINKRRAEYAERISNIEVRSGGVPQGYTRGQLGMGRADVQAFRPTQAFMPSNQSADIHRHFRMLRKQSQGRYFEKREQEMKERYIKGIKENYNSDDPEVKEVIDVIEDMDFDDFYETFQAEDPTFEFSSPKHGKDPSAEYKDHLVSVWNPKKKAGE